MHHRSILCLFAVWQLACAEGAAEGSRDESSDRTKRASVGEDGKPRPDESSELRATYHGAVRAIIEQHCLSCHVEDGIGPMRLDDLDSVKPYRGLLVQAVELDRMPPWPASADCRDLRDVRRLTDDEREVLKAWREADFPDGAESDYEPPEIERSVALPEADSVFEMPESYVPDTTLADEYRCFLTKGTFERDTYVTAMDIRPGTREQVHHVQVHKVALDQLEAIAVLDEAERGVGYPCAGGAGVDIESVNIFSWRPGSAAIEFDEGSAALIEAGSAFVLQVHYNNQFLPEGGPVPDKSGVALWTLPEGTEPDFVVMRRGVVGPVGPIRDDFPYGVIAAGESHVVGGASVPMSRLSSIRGQYVQGEIIGMTPHMHGLGTRLSATLSAGESDTCMIDVPEWDFEWQLDYTYSEPVGYLPDQMFNLRCEYDNSPDNQPVLGGKRIAPRDVSWGEGTLDEMCLNYVWLRFERSAVEATMMP